MLRSPLLHFLLLGGLIFAIQSLRALPEDAPVVEVSRAEIAEAIETYRLQMGREPSEAEARAIERQVVDNALWLEQAYALGLHEVDSVVRQRLLLNMRFLEGDTSEPGVADDPAAFAREEALLERAIELGMDRSDTVVRRRLVDRVQAIIRGAVRARPTAPETLEAHYRDTLERWREPPLLDLSHVYLSRDRRGEATRSDAEGLLARLRAEATPIEEAIGLGDPFLAGHRLRGASPNRLVARLGPDFAAAVADARPGGGWLGPYPSAFGQHLVWVHDRVESRVPPLDEIRQRVVEDWIEAESREAMREFLDERRKVVEVRVIEDVRGEVPVPDNA